MTKGRGLLWNLCADFVTGCELTCRTSCSPTTEASSLLGPDWPSAGRLWWTSCGPPYPAGLAHRVGDKRQTPTASRGQSLHFFFVTTGWQCHTEQNLVARQWIEIYRTAELTSRNTYFLRWRLTMALKQIFNITRRRTKKTYRFLSLSVKYNNKKYYL